MLGLQALLAGIARQADEPSHLRFVTFSPDLSTEHSRRSDGLVLLLESGSWDGWLALNREWSGSNGADGQVIPLR